MYYAFSSLFNRTIMLTEGNLWPCHMIYHVTNSEHECSMLPNGVCLDSARFCWLSYHPQQLNKLLRHNSESTMSTIIIPNPIIMHVEVWVMLDLCTFKCCHYAQMFWIGELSCSKLCRHNVPRPNTKSTLCTLANTHACFKFCLKKSYGDVRGLQAASVQVFL